MFRVISRVHLAGLEKLADVFIKENRKPAALLALDHFFSRLPGPELKSYKVQEMSLFLVQFLEYARLLHFIISHPDPLSISSVKKLFCIREISNTEYCMEPGSFLYVSATRNRDGLMDRQLSALSKNDMVSALRKYLAVHLCERVTEENNLCCDALVLSQCLTFIINGNCNHINCPQEHVRLADLNPKRYNVRLGIHLQQICILQVMYSVNSHIERRSACVMIFLAPRMICSRPLSVLDWLTLLYEAFNPQFHVQGSIADFDISSIPGAREGMGAMKHWVREALYTLLPGRLDFLTTILKLTSLLFSFDRSSALKCINQTNFNASYTGTLRLIYPDPDGRCVIEDIVSLFDGNQQTCISSGMKFLMYVWH